jgi:endonuclease-3
MGKQENKKPSTGSAEGFVHRNSCRALFRDARSQPTPIGRGDEAHVTHNVQVGHGPDDSMKPVPGQLGAILDALRKQYGAIELPEPRKPFALIVWENCAYLVDDERRAQTYERLRKTVGIAPQRMIAAGAKRIESAIREGGMQPPHRAAKVFASAQLALDVSDEEWRDRRVLKRFPGIADPGADKVLLLCGLGDAPALDSNGLRVLERLHVVKPGQAYAAAYRAGVGALSAAGVRGQKALDAFALLRAHGRELCKRAAPLCAACSLRHSCPSASERTSSRS